MHQKKTISCILSHRQTYGCSFKSFTICRRLLPTSWFYTQNHLKDDIWNFATSFIKGMWGFVQVCHSLSNFISVSALKCYNCIGTEAGCSKNELEKDSSKETTCLPGFDRCMRKWYKTGDAKAVINSCSSESLCKIAEDAKCGDMDDCAFGCCDTDLCNAGSPVSFSVLLMTVCAALGLALLK